MARRTARGRVYAQLSASRAAQRRRHLLLSGFKPALLTSLAFGEENWDGYTLRQVIPANALALSGSALKFGIAAATSGDANIVELWVGHKGSGYDFAHPPVRATVEGEGAFTIASGSGRTMTDSIEMAFDRTLPLLFAVSFGPSSRVPYQWFVGDGFDSAYQVGLDASAQEAADGYTAQDTKMTMVDLIEVRRGPAPVV